MTIHNFIEVCSGAGGLSQGFINNKFDPILLNDNDKYCIETLKLNHKNSEIFEGSMKDINLDKYINTAIDVLMGGVPCQSFSQAGKRGGINDERGQLIFDFIKMIDKLNPKVFLIENVKGLLSHNNGETFKYIINKIEKLNKYNISYSVLNSNDYSVPQNEKINYCRCY